jgi:5'-nucleotidase
MHALITNDDGYEAAGLNALIEAAKHFGRVTLVAPKVEQSAKSHTLTLRGGIPVQEVSDSRVDDCFIVDGTPADCVRLGLGGLCREPVDFVLSGINHGANIGVDYYYSGTVAAAREAAFYNIRAMAFSQHYLRDQKPDWSLASELADDLIRQVCQHPYEMGTFWNVNLPCCPTGERPTEIHVVPVATPGIPLSHDRDEHNRYSYTAEYHNRPSPPMTDVSTVFEGHIAVTPIQINPTHLALMALRFRSPGQ